MGNMVGPNQDQKSYRVILFVLVALVALSSAMKELTELRNFSLETADLVAEWSTVIAPSVAYAAPIRETTAERVSVQNNSDEFRWRGTVSRGAIVEVKGINGAINAEPANDNQVEVLAV